jgi:hypothetical protein
MAKVWPVYEGREPTTGGPWASLPVLEAVALLEVRPTDRLSDLNVTPRFGDASRDLWYLGFQHVMLEIGADEAQPDKWQAGYYKSHLKPKEALTRLIQRAVILELGKENVMRVDLRPGIDSQGSRALQATIVIAPDATSKFADQSVLDAIVRIQQLGEEPTIVINFATEAELV